MAGIYGEQLAFFPELMEDYDIFYMAPLVGGGFGERKVLLTVTGYLTRMTKGDLGIVADNEVENQTAVLFVYDEIPNGIIRQGVYVESGGELYKLKSDKVFTKEGGFTIHELQLTTGLIDTQETNICAEQAVLNDY